MILNLKTIILFIAKNLISHEGMHERIPKWFLIMHGINIYFKFYTKVYLPVKQKENLT